VASQGQDERFHEIQLNGKQLVFLFMAATVVSVVIFLCGVLVGRGVRAERAGTDSAAVNPVADVPASRPPAQSFTAAGSDPTTAPPPAPATEDLTYFDRLEKQKLPEEKLKAVPTQKDTKKTKDTKERQAPAAQPAEPGGQGYAVQIAALNVRTEAEAIAKRLTSKGYAAYVVAPPSGTPAVYRVRVGKFPSRREAESIAARLKKEEQFNPWITR
jgi:cell division septation protein DedD